MELLSCEHLSVSYEGRPALTDISFSVEEGDYICVLGENGAGKSTLIKTLLGLKRAESGRIDFLNGFRQKYVGYLPQQQTVKKDFPASVWEVVISGNENSLGFRPFFDASHKKITEENLKKLGIYDLKDKGFRELSGGQQQRVLLCRALCATKKLLILDEPASGLDPVATAELYSIIKSLNEKDCITVIMISHDTECTRKYAKKILHLATRQVFFGSKEDYLSTDIGKRFLEEVQ
ncbi:MAG: ABC transporter ATP-binding protein [Treponema sp.]|nr:ABC transporter ATP-binding protein [Treponema sp.]